MEITPIGIQSLHWQFYIIWVVFNFSFVPLVYFLYPETAARTLEDLDAYYRTSPPLLVFRDKDVTSSKRPAKYAEAEETNIRHASTVDAGAFRRSSRVAVPNQGDMSRMSQSTLGGVPPDYEKQNGGNDSFHVDNARV